MILQLLRKNTLTPTYTEGERWKLFKLNGIQKGKDSTLEIPIDENIGVLLNSKLWVLTDAAKMAINNSLVDDEGTISPYDGPETELGLMQHQRDALSAYFHKNPTGFMLNHAMGTGKTCTSLHMVANHYLKNEIESLVVLAPATTLETVWATQCKKWLPELLPSNIGLRVHVMGTAPKNRQALETAARPDHTQFDVYIFSTHVFSQKAGKVVFAAEDIVKYRRCMMILDESHMAKTPGVIRTTNISKLSKYPVKKVVMTGTSIANGFEDLFCQYFIADPEIIGMRSYFHFRKRFCTMGGFENKKIVGYQNIDTLLLKLRPYTHTVTKDQANDLPPKLYETRSVKITKEQRKMMKDFANGYNHISMEELQARFGEKGPVALELEKMLRYQQIVGGFEPIYEPPVEKGKKGTWHTRPIPGANPKVNEVLNIIESLGDESVIIWCRFIPETHAVKAALTAKYGESSCCIYSGEYSRSELDDNLRRFQDKEFRFMIATQAAGSVGIEMTAATVEIYYSNDFSYLTRIQSEDRAHRTGQNSAVTIIDIISDTAIDRRIQKALSMKKDMATFLDEELSESGSIPNLEN